MADMIGFFVVGTPAPQGSKKSMLHKTSKKIVTFETNAPQQKSWRADIAEAVDQWKRDRPEVVAACPLDDALVLEVTFYFTRPASISVKARPYPSVKPDVDKVSRAVMDCLKINGLITDDARVVDLIARKRYARPGDRTGADVYVTVVPEDDDPHTVRRGSW